MSNDKRPTEKRSVIRSILAQAVLASFAFGWAPAVEVTSSFPEEEVVDAVDDDQLARMPPTLRARALHVLAGDPRASVRVAVAHKSSAIELPLPRATRRLLSQLATDEVPAVQVALARGLADSLSTLGQLERIDVVCSWATSRHDGLRLAAALLLGEPIDALGATACLEHLAADSLPSVRHAAAVAARTRIHDAPARCRAVLLALEQILRDDVQA